MTKTAIRAAALDIASILVFVAVGRRSHDEPGNVITGIAKVAAPFLIALAIAWVVVQAWKRPQELKTGVVVWALTVIDGMLLRHFVFDRGTAASFIVVAAIVTAVFLLGWRLVASRRRPIRI
jgi:chromate transport protein ChrA